MSAKRSACTHTLEDQPLCGWCAGPRLPCTHAGAGSSWTLLPSWEWSKSQSTQITGHVRSSSLFAIPCQAISFHVRPTLVIPCQAISFHVRPTQSGLPQVKTAADHLVLLLVTEGVARCSKLVPAAGSGFGQRRFDDNVGTVPAAQTGLSKGRRAHKVPLAQPMQVRRHYSAMPAAVQFGAEVGIHLEQDIRPVAAQ